jgi:DNA-binding NarL/FixJ family response regulator
MISKMKILIFERSFLIRQGIASVLIEIGQCELADDFSDTAQFLSSVKMFRPGIIIINLDLLKEIPEKTIKSLKKDIEFILIALCKVNQVMEESTIDEIITYNDDKQQIINTLSLFINKISRAKVREKANNQLSEREKDIVTMVAKGLTNKEIAMELFLSVHTVITHRKNIGRKLGIKSVSGITVYAILNKLIEMKDFY